MYKLCKTEQSAARQRRLEQGLLEAMMTLRYEDITVSDLCERMGIPRKSFYRYFSGMEGALYALIDHTLMEFESFSAMLRQKTRSLTGDLESFFLFWRAHRTFLDALQRSNMAGVLIQRTIDHALGDMGVPERFVKSESKKMQEYLVTFSICGMMTMVLQWHNGGYQQSPMELAQIAQRLLTVPLFPHADQIM